MDLSGARQAQGTSEALIIDYLRSNAAMYSDEVALVEVDHGGTRPRSAGPRRRELTWRSFDEEANRVSHLLMAHGVLRGDRVGILMTNSLEWLPIYFGILKAGALAVPLNFRFTADEIEFCLDLADVAVLVFGHEFVDRVAPMDRTTGALLLYVGDDCPSFAVDYHAVAADMPDADPLIPLSPDDDAAIYFTSGTTGFPKGILHGHRALAHAAVVEQRHHGQTRDDVFLCIPPLYHTGAKMHWFGSLITGSRGVLLRGVSPQWICQTVSDEGCTNVWLLVPWAQDILLAIERGELDLAGYRLDQWHLMHIGAQPVPESLIRQWQTIFPGHSYDTNYGLSEAAGPGCVHLGLEHTDRVGAIGRPGHGWRSRVLNDDLDDVEPGQCGELAVQGPGVMKCYYRNPEATTAALVDGWLLTGDIVREDEDGFYWLVDRKKDVIITGGENIYPVQIESFLAAHPDIRDVAVIGCPDERLGEVAVAVIEAKPETHLSEQSVVRFCAGLPRYKRPASIVFSKVPRNPTGKIDKPLLRRRHGSAASPIAPDHPVRTRTSDETPEPLRAMIGSLIPGRVPSHAGGRLGSPDHTPVDHQLRSNAGEGKEAS